MASRKKDNQNQAQGFHPALQRPRVDTLGLATIVGVVALLMISFANLRALDSLESRFDDKMDRLDDRIAQFGKTQVQAQATPAATPPPPRSGPDPERAYPIKTANAPTKGAESAPITIAEFSDFQ